MFIKSARYYDALYKFKDYETGVKKLRQLIQTRHPSAKTLLDVGCGTGKHLEYLRDDYQVEGLDLSREMLEVARQRSPDVPWHLGDMATFHLGRLFDVVTCLFSSIGYVQTVERMERAIAAMAGHLHPGGMLIVEPWFSPEQYLTGTITANFVDELNLKIAWMYTSERKDRLSILDINYLVGEPHGVSYFTERHEIGLFTSDEYEKAFTNAGLRVSYDPTGFFGRGMYVGDKA